MKIAQDGSSPRVWGQAGKTQTKADFFRIIPTRMGTRRVLLLIMIKTRDHPHAYGDKAIDNNTVALTKGSSPRVWGQVDKIIYSTR